MEPKDYSEEILNRKFQTLTPMGLGHSRGYVRNSFFWCNPEKFTIKDARDGLNFEYRNIQQSFKLSKSQLEKLRRAKPGQVIQMTNSCHHHNNWFAILINENEEQEIENAKERLKKVNEEIKEKVGELQKKQRELREKIKDYEKFYYVRS